MTDYERTLQIELNKSNFGVANMATLKQVNYLKNLKYIITGCNNVDEQKLLKITRCRKATSEMITKNEVKIKQLEKLFVLGHMKNHELKESYYEIIVRYYHSLYLNSLKYNNRPKSLFHWLAQLNVIKSMNKIQNNYSIGVFNRISLEKTAKKPVTKTAKPPVTKTVKKSVTKTAKPAKTKPAKTKPAKTKVKTKAAI